MSTITAPQLPRHQSTREEWANSLSHGAGLVAAIAAAPFLLIAAIRHGGSFQFIGAAVFATTVVLLYLASTLYHLVPRSNKNLFRVLDQIAIFLLIAGTYTPFTLMMPSPWGWILFGLAWGIGLVGIGILLVRGSRDPWLLLGLYLGGGWMAVLAADPILSSIPAWGVFWMAAGGLAYTGGVVFYVLDHRQYFHLGWHFCVLAGTTCHFIAVLNYAIATP